MYSDNLRNGELAEFIRGIYLPIIEETNVDLVICGHGHAYERHLVNNRTYLVIGGAGAPLDEVGTSETQIFSVSEHHWLEVNFSAGYVSCYVHGLSGNLIDSFSIAVVLPVVTEHVAFDYVKALFK